MLTRIGLRNFKSIKSLPVIDLEPLTIISGANSSGKTALLQSILLLSQTLRSRTGLRAIELNGESVQLGTWTDVHHADSADQRVEIECHIEPSRFNTAKPRQVGAGTWPPSSSTVPRPPVDRTSEVRLTLVLAPASARIRPTSSERAQSPIVERVVLESAAATQDRSDTGRAWRPSLEVRKRRRSRPLRLLDQWEIDLPPGVERESFNYLVRSSGPVGVSSEWMMTNWRSLRIPIPLRSLGRRFAISCRRG